MKPRIQSSIWNIRNKKTPNHNSKKKEEKRNQKNKDSVRSLWDNFKHTNIHVIGVQEGEEREQEIGNLF